MSRKVKFYLMLDVVGIGIVLLIRRLLVNAVLLISDQWLQTIILIIINGLFVATCLSIVFFFLLYWWSDKKWTDIKNKCYRRKKGK